MKKIFFLLISCLVYLHGFTQITDSLSFSLSQMEISVQGEFTTLSFKECAFVGDTGAPQLPYLKLHYLIPIDKRISHISLSDTVFVTQTLSKTVFPAQPLYPFSETPPAFVEPNLIYYNTNFPNRIIETEGHLFMKGYQVVTVNVYPVQYTGATHTIRVATSMKFTLHFENNESPFLLPKMQSAAMTELIKKQIRRLVRNHEQIEETLGGPLQVWNSTTPSFQTPNIPLHKYVQNCPPEYLIITNNTYLNGEAIPPHNGKLMTDIFQELADWKTQKGIPTAIITLDEIVSATEGVDIEEKIHNFLHDIYYANLGTTFVLFGGDLSIIPSRFMYITFNQIFYNAAFHYPTDLYFTAIEKNWNANGNSVFGEYNDDADKTSEFYYGRALVARGSDAQTFVSKVLEYEKMTNIPNKNYVDNLLFVWGSTPASMINCVADNIAQHNYINQWRLYDDFSNYSGDEDLSRANFIRNLNEGQQDFGNFHLVYHCDHSSPYTLGASWTKKGQKLTRNDVKQLTNDNYFQIFYTNGCEPGAFHKSCIIEHYLNNPNGGGVAAIASSIVSFLEKEYFQNFVNEIYKNVSGNAVTYNIGVAHDNSISPTNDTSKRKYNLFGDPEMPIWTRTPAQLTVSHSPSVVTNTNNEITVNVSGLTYATQKLTVCLLKDNEIYERLCLDNPQNNSEVFTFNVAPQTAGDITLTVTAPNYLPYQTTIPVTITGKNVYVTNTQIIDNTIDGNNNEKIDAGETVNISIELKNNGTVNLSNVTATLSCLSDGVTILFSTCGFGSMNVNNSASARHFQFKVNENIPDGAVLAFKLTITDNNGYSVERSFSHQVHAPVLNILQNQLTLTGNSYNLFVEILNTGSGDARDITAQLTSQNISITAPFSNYGAINSYTVGKNTTAFKIPDSYTNEALELTLTDFYGKTTPFTFQITQPIGTVSNIKHTSTGNSIRLTWNPPGSPWEGYNVYRSDLEHGNYVKLNSRPIPTAAVYNDVGLTPVTEYYYKISYVSPAGNESALSAPYLARTSYPLMAGFPVKMEMGVQIESSINVADVDGDGKKEIFASITENANEGYIIGLKSDGTKLFGAGDPNHSGFAKLAGEIYATPAIGNLKADGVQKIVSVTRNGSSSRLYCHSSQEDPASPGNPELEWSDSALPSNRSPIVADLNGDGLMESIFFSGWWGIERYNTNGLKLAPSTATPRDNSGALAVADIDNNGKKVIIGSYNDTTYPYHPGIYIWKHDGTPYGNQPFYTLPNSEFVGSVIVCDLDNDGENEILAIAFDRNNEGKGQIVAIKRNGTPVNGWDGTQIINFPTRGLYPPRRDEDVVLTTEIAVGDLDGDGNLEVVVLGKNEVKIWKNNGELINTIRLGNSSTHEPGKLTPILADVDGDPEIEIIIPYGNQIRAYKMDGTIVPGFPLYVEEKLKGSPCVADIDNDGKNEIIAGSGNKIYAWKTNGSPNLIEWGSERANPQNTGEYSSSGCGDVTISTNETWSAVRRMCGNITIQPNATLTVKNTTLHMHKETKITVQPGGRLVLNGGTISNFSGQFWQGITVKGNLKQPLTQLHQGSVSLISGGKIENAQCGITVEGGGIVDANNAHFVNNTTGVLFQSLPGQNDCSGTFRKTNFELNGNYIGDMSDFAAHIKTQSSGSIFISGCTFSSVAPPNSNINKNIGIDAMDTHINIQEICHGGTLTQWATDPCDNDVITRTTFTGFSYAISAYNTGRLPRLKTRSCIFQDNFYGIYLSGVSYPELVKNEFIIDQSSSFGVSTSNATGYRIEENIFRERSPISGKNTTGLRIRNSGSAENEVYKNKYQNLHIAQQFLGKNSLHRKTSGSIAQQPLDDIIPGLNLEAEFRITGLQTLCNDFRKSQSTDILVGASKSLSESYIRANQGSMQKPAGNLFHNDEPINIDNKRSPYPIYYYYDEYAVYAEPKNITSNVSVIPISSSNGCPSKLGKIFDETGQEQKPELALAQYDDWDSEYEYWLDKLLASDGNDKKALDMVSYYSALKDNLFNSIIVNAFGGYGENENQDSVIDNLRALFYYRGNYMDYLSIMETFLAENKYGDVLKILANMYNQFAITMEHKMELDGLVTYIEWLQKLEKKGTNIYELSKQELTDLIDYVQSNIGRGVVFANIILCKLYEICLEEEEAADAILAGDPEAEDGTTSPSIFEGAPEGRGSLENITLYPNPTTGELTIKNYECGITNVEIFDIYGRKINSKFKIQNSEFMTNISHLNSGIYFVKITTNAGEVVKKVVKQ